jgi:protease-4
LVAVIAYFALMAGQTTTTTGVPHTAVVEIKGEIADGTEASAAAVIGAVREAFEDSHSMAVVLLINSPGGSPVQAGIINDEIRRLKDIHKKPVYAVVEETCASAAYYVAVSADKIYVDKASVVGSIGVLMDGFGFTGLMEKLGVERRLMTAGANKGFLDPYSPQSPQQRDFAQNMLNQIHQQFIEVVRKGRGNRLKEDSDTFSGLFWSGEQAVKLGLADEMANIEYVAREVVKAPELYDYTRKENVAERIAKQFGAYVGEGAVKAMARQGLMIR